MALVSRKTIELNHGYSTTVSVDDYDMLREYNWRVLIGKTTVYATTDLIGTREDGSKYRTTLLMHRLITSCPPHLQVDHEDRDGLHNWRENLRNLPGKKNRENREPYGATKFRGVDKDKSLYRARITDAFGTRRTIGRFKTAEEAARAYDRAALGLFGQFYGFNFPRSDYGDDALTHPVEDRSWSDIPF